MNHENDESTPHKTPLLQEIRITDKETQVLKHKDDKSGINKYCNKEFLEQIGPAIGWLGVSVAWSLQKGYGTAVLLQLGLTKANVNYVWLAGPISGIIVQPLIGSLSDKLNKRRPFIICGCLSIVINLLIFANVNILSVAIIVFWMNDFCINILMVPLRALSSDKVSSSQHMDTMSWFSIFGSLGSIIIFSFGSITSNVSILYLIGAIIILSTSIITLIIDNNADNDTINCVAHVHAHHHNDDTNLVKNIFIKIQTLPSFIWKIMHAQFWSFCAFLPFWIYIPNFYGENIMNGHVIMDNAVQIDSKEYELYQHGIRYSNFGYCMNSAVMIISSYLIPKLLNKSMMKIFWIISYIFCAIFLCISPFINGDNNLILFMCLHSLCGVTSASMEIFPWQITSSYTSDYDSNNKALVFTIVNLSVCISQVIIGLNAGLIINYFNDDVSALLFVAGICKCIASVCVYFIDVDYKQSSD